MAKESSVGKTPKGIGCESPTPLQAASVPNWASLSSGEKFLSQRVGFPSPFLITRYLCLQDIVFSIACLQIMKVFLTLHQQHNCWTFERESGILRNALFQSSRKEVTTKRSLYTLSLSNPYNYEGDSIRGQTSRGEDLACEASLSFRSVRTEGDETEAAPKTP